VALDFAPKGGESATGMLEAKIVLLGDTGVGKTSIALRFTQDIFQPRTNPTIGASFLMKTLDVGEGPQQQKIKLQIWDTAGQDRFRSLAPMYYRGASAAVLVYDTCSAVSFEKIKDWVSELKTNIQDDIVMFVVGNKVDKAAKHRQLPTETGQAYARSVGAGFIEASAKTNEGIAEIFIDVAKRLHAAKKVATAQNEAISLTVQPQAADTADPPCCP